VKSRHILLTLSGLVIFCLYTTMHGMGLVKKAQREVIREAKNAQDLIGGAETSQEILFAQQSFMTRLGRIRRKYAKAKIEIPARVFDDQETRVDRIAKTRMKRIQTQKKRMADESKTTAREIISTLFEEDFKNFGSLKDTVDNFLKNNARALVEDLGPEEYQKLLDEALWPHVYRNIENLTGSLQKSVPTKSEAVAKQIKAAPTNFDRIEYESNWNQSIAIVKAGIRTGIELLQYQEDETSKKLITKLENLRNLIQTVSLEVDAALEENVSEETLNTLELERLAQIEKNIDSLKKYLGRNLTAKEIEAFRQLEALSRTLLKSISTGKGKNKDQAEKFLSEVNQIAEGIYKRNFLVQRINKVYELMMQTIQTKPEFVGLEPLEPEEDERRKKFELLAETFKKENDMLKTVDPDQVKETERAWSIMYSIFKTVLKHEQKMVSLKQQKADYEEIKQRITTLKKAGGMLDSDLAKLKDMLNYFVSKKIGEIEEAIKKKGYAEAAQTTPEPVKVAQPEEEEEEEPEEEKEEEPEEEKEEEPEEEKEEETGGLTEGEEKTLKFIEEQTEMGEL